MIPQQLKRKLGLLIDDLNADQLKLLDTAIKECVRRKKFQELYIQRSHQRNEAQDTFKPEDRLDYYHGR